MAKKTRPEEKQPLYAPGPSRSYENLALTAPRELLIAVAGRKSNESSESEGEGEEREEAENELPPDYHGEVEEEAARYHHKDKQFFLFAWPDSSKSKVKWPPPQRKTVRSRAPQKAVP